LDEGLFIAGAVMVAVAIGVIAAVAVAAVTAHSGHAPSATG
jgi:hypothetical protein